jgi:hypothetical protein
MQLCAIKERRKDVSYAFSYSMKFKVGKGQLKESASRKAVIIV